MTVQTITLDIINEKAFNLLKDLEQLHLIRLHKDTEPQDSKKPIANFKGKMTKQPVATIEQQLNELRNEWE